MFISLGQWLTVLGAAGGMDEMGKGWIGKDRGHRCHQEGRKEGSRPWLRARVLGNDSICRHIAVR